MLFLADGGAPGIARNAGIGCSPDYPWRTHQTRPVMSKVPPLSSLLVPSPALGIIRHPSSFPEEKPVLHSLHWPDPVLLQQYATLRSVIPVIFGVLVK